MVMQNKKIKYIESFVDLPEEEFKWSSISLSEVKENSDRLEASVFNIEAKSARQLLKKCNWPIVNLWSNSGLVANAKYPNRFKRIYVEEDDGVPFFLPSQITELNPSPKKFISPRTNCNFKELEAKRDDLLLNRSGTIGPISIVNQTLEGKVLSDDVIRIEPKDKYNLGYIYAFLKTKTGQTLLKTNSYGAVISHIEPDHLKDLEIPNPTPLIKQNIHNLITDSFKARDHSNQLIDKTENLLLEKLNLPTNFEDLNKEIFDKTVNIQNYNVKLSDLENRLEASFHSPAANAIENLLSTNAKEVTTIGDNRLTSDVKLPGRFKRVYVEEGQGVAFFGGKEIYSLDPSGKKYLSTSKHKKRIENDLKLHENMILITRSGTVGKMNIVPKHWENWVINEHVIRIVPKNDEIAGFIYAWLNSKYGLKLIEKFIYGAVVDEIDTNHVESIVIPLLDEDSTEEINSLVLKANQLRFKAYKLEKKAIQMTNNLVIHASDEKVSIAADSSSNQKHNILD